MSSNFEQFSINDKTEIEKVWEAYHEKSRECDKLLDDLEDYKSKVHQLESLSRNVKDKHRSFCQYEDMKKKIEKLQIQNAEIIKKEKLARNELDTEKESFDISYKELQIKLKEAVEAVQKIKLKMEMKEKKHSEDLNAFKDQMNTERINLNLNSLKLENRISDLEKKLKEEAEKYEVLEDQYITNISERSCQSINQIQHSDDSESLSNLLSQIQSLNEQLISVKKRVLFQRKIIENICEHPLIASAIKSFEMIPDSTSSSAENSNSSTDFSSSQQDKDIKRNILDEDVDQDHLNHFIEIPQDSQILSEAFKSLREKMKRREDFEVDQNPQPISDQKTPKLPKRPTLTSTIDCSKPINHPQQSKPTKQLPLNHPSKRPSMRAKIEPSHKTRPQVEYTCPVCLLRFETTASSHSIRCHVNGHFSDADASDLVEG